MSKQTKVRHLNPSSFPSMAANVLVFLLLKLINILQSVHIIKKILPLIQSGEAIKAYDHAKYIFFYKTSLDRIYLIDLTYPASVENNREIS